MVARRLAEIVHIFDRDVNAIIHPRRVSDALRVDVTAVLGELAQPRKLVVEVEDDLHKRVQRGLACGVALSDDIAFWAGIVADLCDVPLVGIRLVLAGSAMCPRFHVDRILARIAITYLGPGTELLAEDAVDRSKLAVVGELDDIRSGLVRDPTAITRASAGDVVVMKGELWSADVGGAVHRSPEHQMPRLLLTLDPLG